MKPIVVDYRNRTISLSSAFEKKAFTPGTAEYAQLQSVRVDFPDFRLSTREFKTNTKQDRHKGLTYKFMREYITAHENAPSPVLEVLEDMIGTFKGHSLCKRYPTIKAWFLNRYPAYAEFGMTADELAKWRVSQKQEEKVTEPTALAPAIAEFSIEPAAQEENLAEASNITELPTNAGEDADLPKAANA